MWEDIMEIFSDVTKVEEQMRQLEAQMSDETLSDRKREEILSSYSHLSAVFDSKGGFDIQTKIKTAINQDLKVVKVPSQINKVYVMVFCNYAQKWFLEKSSGTTVKGIKIDAVLQMPFPLPPLAEQKRIVDRIEEIFKSLDEISLHLV